MILNSKEFTVQDTTIIVGHNRINQKRYFCVEIQELEDVQRFIPIKAENSKFWNAIKSIFWLE